MKSGFISGSDGFSGFNGSSGSFCTESVSCGGESGSILQSLLQEVNVNSKVATIKVVFFTIEFYSILTYKELSNYSKFCFNTFITTT